MALTLHKTIAEMLETMTMQEFASWQQFFAEREQERQRAENKARGIVDFSDPNAAQDLIALVHKGGKP